MAAVVIVPVSRIHVPVEINEAGFENAAVFKREIKCNFCFFFLLLSSLNEEYNAAAGAGLKYNGHLGTPFIDPCLFGWLLFFSSQDHF